MKYVKLAKASLYTLFVSGAVYVLFGIFSYAFAPKIPNFPAVVQLAGSVGLWQGIACVVMASVSWIILSSGLKKNNDCRAFLCSQMQYIAVALTYVAATIALILIVFVLALKSIGGESKIGVVEKAVWAVFYLPAAAVMILSSIALGFARKECLPPQGEGLPVHPDMERIAAKNNAKFIITVVESALCVIFNALIVVVVMAP